VAPPPVLASGIAHGVHVGVARRPLAIGEMGDEVVVGGGPLGVRTRLPIGPVHEGATEVEDHCARSGHPFETVRNDAAVAKRAFWRSGPDLADLALRARPVLRSALPETDARAPA